MMDRYRAGYGGNREHSTVFSSKLSHLSPSAASKTRPMQACTVQKDMHVCMHPPPCNFSDRYTSTEAFLRPSDIDHPPYTHMQQIDTERRGVHARKSSSPAFLNLTFTFFNLPTHLHLLTHIHTHTHKAHTAFPGHSACPLSGGLHGQRGQDSPY